MKLTSLIHRLWVPITILTLILISPADVSVWNFSQDTLQETRITQEMASAQVVRTIQTADLNGDGKKECLELIAEDLSITDCEGRDLWKSPAGWRVKEAQIGDLNRDSEPEAVLLVWRPFQPWPIDRFVPSGGRIKDFHDLQGFSCHIILIGWIRGGYNELWAGSALIQPVSQLLAVDLDGDNWQELAALEGQYDLENKGGYLTIWKWNGFGFTLADEVRKNFQQLIIVGNTTDKWIFVQK
ncbi:MAG: hypothetical protein AB9897_06415 [Anaerolineaceae bacterium]